MKRSRGHAFILAQGRRLSLACVEPTSLAETATGTAAEGVEGNARLTAAVAIVLLLLLGAEGATLLAMHQLLHPHVFLGFALIPPVALKIASTLYRFVRYYGGNAAYRRKGPPHMLLRILGPAVILLTAALLGSGVGLGYTSGSTRQAMLFVHKASFVLWFGAMTVHVLGHVLETARVGPRDWRPVPAITGRTQRRWLLVGSVAAGVVLGVWGLSFLGLWGQFGQ